MNTLTDIKHCALNLLARREHSQSELRAKLKLRQCAPDLIEQVLQQVMQENLQSDARFTESYIHMRANKGYGPVRIAAELHERGVKDEVIEEYLNHEDFFWINNLTTVYHKKFGRKAVKDFSEQAKRMRFLQYRGFTGSQIKAAKFFSI